MQFPDAFIATPASTCDIAAAPAVRAMPTPGDCTIQDLTPQHFKT
ncbi:MAG: hypothetical protein ACJ8G1_21045 [Vitreoscilla sp.]